MLLYNDFYVSLIEVPDEISLVIPLIGCKQKCKGCHSPWLWDGNEGKTLDSLTLEYLVNLYPHITCITLLGGDWDIRGLTECLSYIKTEFINRKAALYTGKGKSLLIKYPQLLLDLDYIKLGAYEECKGGLESPTTNQRMYTVTNGKLDTDITYKFRRANV